MTATHKNFLKTTISAVASAGLGAFTISTASSGYRTFGAGDDGLTFDGVTIKEGTSWEVRDGCVYTHSGTSLSRGTLQDSSTGSAIAFTSAAVVEQNPSADWAELAQLAMASIIPGGRLTLESGVPVSTTDQTAKTSVYYTPFVHNVVPLWDGYKWVPVEFTEKTLALGTLTGDKPYDVFGYLSAGALVLESLAWTNDTTRATAVTLQDGRYCKDGDKTRLLLGTFYTTSTTTTEDSGFGSTTAPSKRYLWNAYNRVKRSLQIEEDTASWTWTGTALTWRQWRAATDNHVAAVVGLPGVSTVSLEIDGTHDNNTANGASSIGIGYDSTTTLSANCFNFYGAAYTANAIIAQHARLEQVVPVGRHYWAMLEENVTAANTMKSYGTVATARRSGMVGWVEA